MIQKLLVLFMATALVPPGQAQVNPREVMHHLGPLQEVTLFLYPSQEGQRSITECTFLHMNLQCYTRTWSIPHVMHRTPSILLTKGRQITSGNKADRYGGYDCILNCMKQDCSYNRCIM